VADIWHLLHNLAEAVERIVGRHRADLREPLDQPEASAGRPATETGELDLHGRPRPLVARTRERYQQIHERIQRGDSLRAIARELKISRLTVRRFADATDVEELLVAATHRASILDNYRLYLHHRWMEGCTNAAQLTREIHQLGYRGDVNTVRRHLRPYRNGAIPAHAPMPRLTVRRVTGWIMSRPERLTDMERKHLEDLCERSPALATTTDYARRLATMLRERRNEHLAFDVWLTRCPPRRTARAAHPRRRHAARPGRHRRRLHHPPHLRTGRRQHHAHQAAEAPDVRASEPRPPTPPNPALPITPPAPPHQRQSQVL
jgi:hypothetical protein